MKKVFDKYASYYDLLYSDKNYENEVSYINKIISSLCEDKPKIIELGSGSGIHGRLLGELGYKVTGIERSQKMIGLAKTTNNFSCVEGDITTFSINDRFDLALSLFHVVSYLTNNNQIELLFRNVNKHLKLGGYFIFDVWHSPCVLSIKPSNRVKRVKNERCELVRIAEPEVISIENCINVNYTIFTRKLNSESWESFSEKHTMRHFSIPEIAYFSYINGYEFIRAEEFLTGNKPGEDTWGVCYVLKKVLNVS